MSLQLEDVVDCLQVMYPEFEFMFLFDHSQGHVCSREGALNALQMSRTYGEHNNHERHNNFKNRGLPWSSLTQFEYREYSIVYPQIR